ncbi:MAG: CRISPR-associated endonuclease Cas1 [Caldisphaeraceae archaeon]|nr:CRISPR-associated endonuclease Cas1 [Caldisphaeraceae archaeon]
MEASNRILIVNGYGVRIGVHGNAISISSKEGKSFHPLWEVDAVIVSSGGVSVSSRLLRLLASSGIELIVMDSRGMPVAITYFSHLSRTPETRRSQYIAFSSEKWVNYAKSMIACKISSQAESLRRISLRKGKSPREYKKLKAISKEVLSKEPRSDPNDFRKEIVEKEAYAARIYWSSIASLLNYTLNFNGRDQDSSDPVNIALNYGYAPLYSYGFKYLVLSGLDPYAGFVHVDRSGKPTLVFDYIEQFRSSIVDEAITALFMKKWRPRFEEGLLDRESRLCIIKAINERLSDQAINAYRPMSYAEALKEYAFRLASSLRSSSSYICSNYPGDPT